MQLIQYAIRNFMANYGASYTGLCCLLLAQLLLGCDVESVYSTKDGSAVMDSKSKEITGDGRLLIASGAEFQIQDANTVRYAISAASISTVPRSFGAFNLNGLNELLMDSVQLNVFPITSGQAESDVSNELASDVSDSLRNYLEALPKVYGVISRIRMTDIEIVLHGAGKGGTPVKISAERLFKDFSDDKEPELYNVEFYDDYSSNVLKVNRVVWNTQTDNFLVTDAIVR
jgi:hypothetical protein